MNLCILSGKVINDIELKFVYNADKKSLSKRHISIVELELEIEKEQVIKLHAYNEMADFIYRYIKKEGYILIEGKIRNNYIEIENVRKI